MCWTYFKDYVVISSAHKVQHKDQDYNLREHLSRSPTFRPQMNEGLFFFSIKWFYAFLISHILFNCSPQCQVFSCFSLSVSLILEWLLKIIWMIVPVRSAIQLLLPLFTRRIIAWSSHLSNTTHGLLQKERLSVQLFT